MLYCGKDVHSTHCTERRLDFSGMLPNELRVGWRGTVKIILTIYCLTSLDSVQKQYLNKGKITWLPNLHSLERKGLKGFL